MTADHEPATAGTALPASPSRRGKRADALRNREKIFKAARQAFTEHPDAAGMEEIAKLAGVGVGTLYRNFPRRVDLVEAIYREDLHTLAVLAENLGTSQQPWDALATWLRALLDYSESKRTLIAELQHAFARDPELASESSNQVHSAAAMVLHRAQAAGVVRADLTAADLIQLVAGLVHTPAADLARTSYLLGIILDAIREPA